MDHDKLRENRLRRAAKRVGWLLRKSRRRNENAADFGGYMIIDFDNCVVAGGYPCEFCLSLADVEAWLEPSRSDR